MNAYKKYLKGATKKNFRLMFGDLARNARGWMDLTFDIRELPELINEDLDAAWVMGCKMLHEFYNKKPYVNSVEDRKEDMWVKNRLKKIYRRKQINREFYEDSIVDYYLKDDGEYLIPIIHGGDLGRINAALKHGRGYRTESMMPNHKMKVIDETGLMFHSKWSGRAKYYANSAACQRVGVEAILMGYIKRKYVWQNEDRDEYSLPPYNYDKLVNVEIITSKDKKYWCVEDYYDKTYRNEENIERITKMLPTEKICQTNTLADIMLLIAIDKEEEGDVDGMTEYFDKAIMYEELLGDEK